MKRIPSPAWLMLLSLFLCGPVSADEPSLRVGRFSVDASPPVGSPLAYDPTIGVQTPLSCSGIVLLGSGEPIVLCAIDWIGVGNDGNREFRRALAKAAGTTPNRVAVHSLHQHDAPACDFTAAQLLAQHGVTKVRYDSHFSRQVIERAAEAVAQATADTTPVTHVGVGEGEIEKVASNRRVMGEDGKVKYVRYSATRNPVIRDAPVGTIDPMLKMISFWNGESAVAVLTYYATHPQSYYRTGLANPDFPGMARNARQAETGVPHTHFNGAGGNIGAGKWNDGSKENRQVLADRVAAGMKKAWEATKRTPIAAADIGWETESVQLPVGKHLQAEPLQKILEDTTAAGPVRQAAARNLVWLRRCEAGDWPIEIACLRIGKARVLHMPGELFVEYQLAAQKQRPDLFVAMAAYGDYAPGYIGTEIAYGQGGYETSERASRVAPQVEGVLSGAVNRLLAD
ncbi:hypothetical protein EC9_02850 [Rosistilla ulvae]|uniref:Neutral/alkaline non-lysosomal ceramidase n=1 Tax=Rosistilla ulvae TaxID=1930277 RepID=A0A517LU40_9BACT|nr:hypothetical protein [Rosistilla ulvae]QDS86126.1 hypothetical protein EC9_02850 [Rosistilla ulvae]